MADLLVPPVETSKTWVAYLVTVSPSATNAVDAPHVFTITATRSDGDPVDGASVAYTWSGAGTATPASSCTTDAAGVCTVTVTSSVSGDGDVDGDERDRRCVRRGSDGAGRAGAGGRSGCAVDGVEDVVGVSGVVGCAGDELGRGAAHVHAPRVEQSADGTTWTPVPDGTTLTATTAGSGTLDTAASTCATGGTTAGRAPIVVTDDGAGHVDLDGDGDRGHDDRGLPVTDLVVPPVTTSKTWLTYLVQVSESATNAVGAPHVFTITAERSDGDPVDGATIAYTLVGRRGRRRRRRRVRPMRWARAR